MSPSEAPTVRRPTPSPARPRGVRVADTRAALRDERHLWLSTAAGDVPHLVPLSFVVHDDDLYLTGTPTRRWVATIRSGGSTGVRVTAAVGSAQDVVLVGGLATALDPADVDEAVAPVLAGLPLSPARVPGCVVVRLTPQTVMTWRGMHEMADRVIMRDGEWATD